MDFICNYSFILYFINNYLWSYKVVYERSDVNQPAPVVENLFPEPEQPQLPASVIEPEVKFDEGLFLQEETFVVPNAVVEASPEKAEPDQAEVSDFVVEIAPEPEPEKITPAVEETKKTSSESEKAKPAAKGPVWRAQLLSSADKKKVETSWQQISKKHKALLSDMPYQIISATIPGKGTFWRLQVGAFDSKEKAANLCAKLKKKKQDCIPSK